MTLILPGFRDDLDDAFGPKRTRNEGDGDGRAIHARHEHSWVTPRLAVGSIVQSYDDVATLLRAGITHVLDLAELSPAAPIYRQVGIEHVSLPAPDDGKPRAWELLRDGVQFGDRALRTDGARLLVHCYAGISRSTSMCYAILRARGADEAGAVDLIMRARRLAVLTYKGCADARLADLVALVNERAGV